MQQNTDTANSSSDATFDVISASSSSSVVSDNECEDWQTHCSELMSKFNTLQRLYKQHKVDLNLCSLYVKTYFII